MGRIGFVLGSITVIFFTLMFFVSCSTGKVEESAGYFRIGWASTSITPDVPVIMSGGSRARISTGVMDSLTATAFVLESVSGEDQRPEHIITIGMPEYTGVFHRGNPVFTTS